jgi:hypothetical protein
MAANIRKRTRQIAAGPDIRAPGVQRLALFGSVAGTSPVFRVRWYIEYLEAGRQGLPFFSAAVYDTR